MSKPHRSKAEIALREMRVSENAARLQAGYGPKQDRIIRCTNPKCDRVFAEKGPLTSGGAGIAPRACFYCGSPLQNRFGV